MADTEWSLAALHEALRLLADRGAPGPEAGAADCLRREAPAKALTDSAASRRIDVVDISRDVVDIGRIVCPNPPSSRCADPRVRLHIEDGRYFLQTTDQRFDLITSEPPPPQSAGTVRLHTREYFSSCDRLAEGGIVAYWLPARACRIEHAAILRASAMPSRTARCGTPSAATDDGGHPPRSRAVSEEQFARQWHERAIAAEMRRSASRCPSSLARSSSATPPT